jgi:hypothetical protein
MDGDNLVGESCTPGIEGDATWTEGLFDGKAPRHCVTCKQMFKHRDPIVIEAGTGFWDHKTRTLVVTGRPVLRHMSKECATRWAQMVLALIALDRVAWHEAVSELIGGLAKHGEDRGGLTGEDKSNDPPKE